MSNYKYIPTGYKNISHKMFMCGPFPKDTLQDQADAFDELRKRTAIECKACRGTGFTEISEPLHPQWPMTFWYNCESCHGEGIYCSYCFKDVTECTCGKDSDE